MIRSRKKYDMIRNCGFCGKDELERHVWKDDKEMVSSVRARKMEMVGEISNREKG